MFRKSKGGAVLFDKNAYHLNELQTIKDKLNTILSGFLAETIPRVDALTQLESLLNRLNTIAVQLAINM